MKKFRSLVDFGGVCCKGIIVKSIMAPMGVPKNRQSLLIIKRDVTGAYVHESRPRNIPYGQTVRRSIYKTIRPKHPYSPIRRSTTTPRDPRFTALLQVGTCLFYMYLSLPDYNTTRYSRYNKYGVKGSILNMLSS